MRRLSLGTLLIGVNVGLVAAAVLGVVVAGSARLRRLADAQAVARVQLAGQSARLALERAGEDLVDSGRLLAEKPAFERLLEVPDPRALSEFLEDFRLTSGLDGAALVLDGRVFARGSGDLDWPALASAGAGAAQAAAGTPAWFFSAAPAGRTGLTLAASVPVRGAPRARLLTAQVADPAFTGEIASRAGLPVAILPRREALESESPRAAVRGRVAYDGAAAAERIDEGGVFLAVEPLAPRPGEVAAVVETWLPTEDVDKPVRRLVHSLLFMGLIVGGFAALFSVVIGRRLVRPLSELTRASARLGRGDLVTPIPHAPRSEEHTSELQSQ